VELPLQLEQLKSLVLKKIEDMKGRDVVVLNVENLSDVTDCMVICSGNSKRHVQSIAEHVSTSMKHAGSQPLGVEGQTAGDWVLVDLGDLVLHVMQDEARDFYQLEKLWSKQD
jgi:ribosome-associated protein